MIFIQNSRGDVIEVTEEKWEFLKTVGWDKKWVIIKRDAVSPKENIVVEEIKKVTKPTKEVLTKKEED